MRFLSLLALLALVGCSPDVCGSFGGKTCIALDVRGGNGTTLSVLHVVATSGFTLDKLDSRTDNAVLSLPVAVAVVPPDDFSGDFTLDLTAQLGSSVVGHAVVSGFVESKKHVRLTVPLDGLSDGDMAVPPDFAGADFASSDLAQDIPADTECNNVGNAWVADMKDATSCGARHAGPVDTDVGGFLVTGVDDIHIARNNGSGVVGIVSKGEGDGGLDTVALLVSQFTGYAWPPVVKTSSYGGVDLGDRPGTYASIAVGGDGIHLCYLDTSDSGNEIHHTIVDGNGNFGSPETVATGQGPRGEVAIALEQGGVVLCAYYDAMQGNIYGNQRSPGATGSWGTTPAMIAAGFPGEANVGAVSMLSTGTGAVLGGQVSQSTGSALPVFASYDGSKWSMVKSVDNAVPNGLYGQDAHIARLGSENAVTYFYPSGNTWALRSATFSSASDQPTYTDVYQNAAGTQTGAHHAVAYDQFGLLHVALITPDSTDPTTASLLYLRQYPDGHGAYKWLSDLVDPMAGDGNDVSSVDLVVDDHNRPHIAYYSGERTHVMYATRTDRP